MLFKHVRSRVLWGDGLLTHLKRNNDPVPLASRGLPGAKLLGVQVFFCYNNVRIYI